MLHQSISSLSLISPRMTRGLLVALNVKPQAIEIVFKLAIFIKRERLVKYQVTVKSNKKCLAIKELRQAMLGYAYLNLQFKALSNPE